MKAYVGENIQVQVFLNSILAGSGPSGSRSSLFTLRKRAPGIHLMGTCELPYSFAIFWIMLQEMSFTQEGT
jgi:hypothetical protein